MSETKYLSMYDESPEIVAAQIHMARCIGSSAATCTCGESVVWPVMANTILLSDDRPGSYGRKPIPEACCPVCGTHLDEIWFSLESSLGNKLIDELQMFKRC